MQENEYDYVTEMAFIGKKVAEILGTTLHSFDPDYSFGSTGTMVGNMRLPKHVVEKIYSLHLEIEQMKQNIERYC